MNRIGPPLKVSWKTNAGARPSPRLNQHRSSAILQKSPGAEMSIYFWLFDINISSIVLIIVAFA